MNDYDDIPGPDRAGELPPELVQPQTTALAKTDPKVYTLNAPVGLAGKPEAKGLAAPTRQEEMSPSLTSAYNMAGTLKLTAEEAAACLAPFDDEQIAIRPHDGLLYIPHIHVSNRLTQVLGPGQWVMVRRWERIEGSTIYAEWVLIARGCLIGEAVGAQEYHASNPKHNYSDALEGTRGEALRRICGKGSLSIGAQVWDPNFCDRWVALYAEAYWTNDRRGQRVKMWRRKPMDGSLRETPRRQAVPGTPAPAPGDPAEPPAAKPVAPASNGLQPAATSSPKPVSKATTAAVVEDPETKRQRWLKMIRPLEPFASAYLKEQGLLIPTETIDDLPADKVPATKQDAMRVIHEIEELMDKEQAAAAASEPDAHFATGDPDPPAETEGEEWWRDVPIPFGSNKGMLLREIDKDKLFGWWANYQPKPWTSPDGKKTRPVSPGDIQFRKALDAAGEHYGFKLK